jgi:hypothetical protein
MRASSRPRDRERERMCRGFANQPCCGDREAPLVALAAENVRCPSPIDVDCEPRGHGANPPLDYRGFLRDGALSFSADACLSRHGWSLDIRPRTVGRGLACCVPITAVLRSGRRVARRRLMLVCAIREA